MDLVRLTRELIDIESISGNEAAVAEFVCERLDSLGYQAELMPVEAKRANVFARPPGDDPDLVLSTHLDTVPPFIASREDERRIWGRGACDAKGIMAAQIAAAERLRAAGAKVGLLFLVGEERDSLGAKVANQRTPARPPRFLINGEPTENRVAVASKGALRLELTARGKMAHSAYPELGDSAIARLVEALHRLLAMDLPKNPEVGPCTVNIGLIEGGRAPNVIPDFAQAQVLYRLVGPSEKLRHTIEAAVRNIAEANFTLEIPFVKLDTVPGVPTMVAAFTTDIPALTQWGRPLLLGPGSIHVAHTEGEFIDKQQLSEAVDLYVSVAQNLLQQ
jgi:acetylornithine deacetylase